MQQILRPSRLAMLVALAAVPAWAQAAYPAYQAGTAYKAGDIVSNAGALYECKEFPYSGWCGASPYHYAPGVGVVWADAWKLYGGEVPPPALVVAIGSPAVGSSVRHRASAMNALNSRFFMSFLLEKSSCLYMEIRHLPDVVFTGRPALNAAFSLRSWLPPGASRPACRGCG